jgi:hypothetical protein
VKRTDVTYGQLDSVLRSLGFSSRLVKGKPPARHYEHKETGAFITMRPFPESDRVLEHLYWFSENRNLAFEAVARFQGLRRSFILLYW